MERRVFITGGTGYIGRELIDLLVQQRVNVTALIRKGSESKLPAGCKPVIGDALDAQSFIQYIPPADTFVQLVGISHPNPFKPDEFRRIDLQSVRESVFAAVQTGIRHFIYVSVAQPAPIMKEYIRVRAEGESLIWSSGISATILRPWYVLGPHRRWPVILLPAYWVFERLPATKESARRLGFVTVRQMTRVISDAVLHPSEGVRILDVSSIRQVLAG